MHNHQIWSNFNTFVIFLGGKLGGGQENVFGENAPRVLCGAATEYI